MSQDILVSLHGRQLGLDRYGFLASPIEHNSVEASTATPLAAAGVSRLSSAATDYTMDPPVPGVRRNLVTTTTSTLVRTVTLTAGNFQSTSGSSFSKLTFNGGGQSIGLVGLSTALYVVCGNHGVTLST